MVIVEPRCELPKFGSKCLFQHHHQKPTTYNHPPIITPSRKTNRMNLHSNCRFWKTCAHLVPAFVARMAQASEPWARRRSQSPRCPGNGLYYIIGESRSHTGIDIFWVFNTSHLRQMDRNLEISQALAQLCGSIVGELGFDLQAEYLLRQTIP